MTSLKSAALIAAALASVAGCYTISVRAAAERSAIATANARIARDTADIRLLRAELRTRSRLPELQRWNEQVLALVPPSAEQMVANPLMLASFAVDLTPAAAATVPVATVVRDAPRAVPTIREASFVAPATRRTLDGTGPSLVADAINAAPAGFRKVALR